MRYVKRYLDNNACNISMQAILGIPYDNFNDNA